MARAKKDLARAVVREYFDALLAKDLDRAVATWKPGSQDRLYGFADIVAPHGIRDYFAGLFGAVPDFTIEVDSMVAEGDQVAVHWHAAGTFDGSQKFQGLVPNGRRVELEGLDLLTVEDGLIVENHAYTNAMDTARKLGALPPQQSIGEKAMLGAFNAKTRLTSPFKRS